MADYYGIPMLKRPLWRWEIALYFFAEGISAGSFVLATMADVFGGQRYRKLIRAADYISVAMLLPCPPLLIADLGRPERFHHMLRVFKPTSPMNLGAWALTGYGQQAALVAFWPKTAIRLAGLPFALFMVAYPGVLLTTTSIPLWNRTRALGAVLGTSSMASASSALELWAAVKDAPRATRESLHSITTVAHVAEAAALTTYVAQSHETLQPLTKGRYSRMFWAGAVAVGVALPMILAPGRGSKHARTRTILSSVSSLVGALALKWAVVHAGRDSADDPAANRYATRSAGSLRENPVSRTL
jgi:formate-dependent nitrite reductase membrane component NrfD